MQGNTPDQEQTQEDLSPTAENQVPTGGSNHTLVMDLMSKTGGSFAGLVVECFAILVKTLEEQGRPLESEGFFGMVTEFHKKMGIVYEGPPRKLPHKLDVQRKNHLGEEYKEYLKARNQEDALDALCDIIYVACGTAYLHGYDLPAAFGRVHASNMRKECEGTGPKQGVIKPVGWKKPYLKDLV